MNMFACVSLMLNIAASFANQYNLSADRYRHHQILKCIHCINSQVVELLTESIK